MIEFAAAVLFLIITPGPGVLSAAGVGSGFGFRPGTNYIGGLFIGTNLVSLAVISGAAALVFSVPGLREILLYASAAYLFYLALKIAFSGSKIAIIAADRAPGIPGGIALQAINPKAYAVNTTLFSGFAFWPENFAVEVAVKLLIINLIWLPIHFLWLYAGVSLRRLDLKSRTQFIVNLLMAVSMLASVGLAVYAQ